MTDRYVLHHDGTWYYHLDGPNGYLRADLEAFADGQPMTPIRRGDRLTGWWATDRQAQLIQVVTPAPLRVTGYRLTRPEAESVLYPATLTPEQWEQRRHAGGEDDSTLWGLYERVTETGGTLTEEVSGPWLRLDGQPPPDDGHTWTARLPYVLSQYPEYLHLFPGHIGGFRDAMKALVKTLPRVDGAYEEHGRLHVTVKVPFDPPQEEPWRPRGARKDRTRPVLCTRYLTLDIPQRISGPNRAAAVAEWGRRRGEIVNTVAAAGVAACPHCSGAGWVET